MATGALRATSAPLVILMAWFGLVALALPAARLVEQAINASVDGSLVEKKLTRGFDHEWFGEFEGRGGIAGSFDPTLSGVGAFLDNIERRLNGTLFEASPELVGLALVYAIFWLFLQAGFLVRCGTKGEEGRPSFLIAAAGMFGRFLRLALLSIPFYLLIYRFSVEWFEGLDEKVREGASESSALFFSAMVWVVTALLLLFVRASAGYGKAVLVSGVRRSAVLAWFQGAVLCIAHPAKTVMLYGSATLVGLVLLGIYGYYAPMAGPSQPRDLAIAFAFGQLFLVSKIWTRFTLLAAQQALVQDIYSRSAGRSPDPTAAGTTLKAPIAGSIVLLTLTLTAGCAARSTSESTPAVQTERTMLDRLHWLAGSWEGAGSQGEIEVVWLPPKGRMMLGMQRSVRPTGAASFDFLRIVGNPAGVVLLYSPGGSRPLPYNLAGAGRTKISFVNEERSFPRKITWRSAGSKLEITLSGVASDGTTERVEVTELSPRDEEKDG